MNELLQILGAISDPVSLILGAVLTAIPSYFLYKKGIEVAKLESNKEYDLQVLKFNQEQKRSANKVIFDLANHYSEMASLNYIHARGYAPFKSPEEFDSYVKKWESKAITLLNSIDSINDVKLNQKL